MGAVRVAPCNPFIKHSQVLKINLFALNSGFRADIFANDTYCTTITRYNMSWTKFMKLVKLVKNGIARHGALLYTE